MLDDEEKEPERTGGGDLPTGKVLLGSFALFLAVCAGTWAALAYSTLRPGPGAPEATAPPAESFDVDLDPSEDTIAPEDVQWDKPTGVVQNLQIRNVLLIGQDRRPGEERARSDTLILCSVDLKMEKITLISLMRDMYVPIPGYEDNRINAAFALGGMELLDRVLEQDFGIVPDGNIAVDFDGFLQVMAAATPLEIELTAEETAYLNSRGGWALVPGLNALDAPQLLEYARTRSVGQGDYDRTERQRKVLSAAFQKLRLLPATELFTLAEAALPYLSTDMSGAEILDLIFSVISRHMTMGESCRIPVDGAYTDQTIRGMSVLVPDLAANSRALREYIYGE